jgi:hypothetical protein
VGLVTLFVLLNYLYKFSWNKQIVLHPLTLRVIQYICGFAMCLSFLFKVPTVFVR